MAEIRKTMMSIAVAMFSSLLISGCGSMKADRLEIDADRVNFDGDRLNVDNDRYDLEDGDRLEVDPDRFNVDDDSPS